MEPNVSAVERAFQLAASARYLTVSEIKVTLAREGYRHELVEGRQLAKQLLAVITRARSSHAAK
jgi:hypothetical protein